jgi:2-dehydropantoate 2-reductase
MKLKPHFIVYGVGAVGGMYGAQLEAERKWQNLDYKVSFIARSDTFRTLKQDGIKFHVRNDDESIDRFDSKLISVYEKLEDLSIKEDEYPVILLCVKSKDTKNCSSDIANFIKIKNITEYSVISIQNGVENEDILASVLGKEKVIGAYTNVLAEVIKPGDYVRKGNYWLTLGELEGNQGLEIEGVNRIDFIAETLQSANIIVKKSTDIRADLWEKLVWNAAFNPISVLYEADIRSLLDNPKARERIISVMRETRELAQKLKINLDPEIDSKHFKRTDSFNWQGFKTSMLQDYLRNRPIEIEQLLGVVVRLSKAHDLDAKHSTELYEDLHQKLAV